MAIILNGKYMYNPIWWYIFQLLTHKELEMHGMRFQFFMGSRMVMHSAQ